MATALREPRLYELDREIAAEEQRERRSELREKVSQSMMLAHGSRLAEAEQRAREAIERADKQERQMADLCRQMLELQEAHARVRLLARHNRPVGSPMNPPYGRVCFICGCAGWCSHREPELAELEERRIERRNRE